MARRVPLLALTATACLALSGCGGAAPGKSSTYRIAVIPKGLTHQHWQSVQRGAERAAADLTAQGVATEILYDGPTRESDALEQINLIRVKAGLGIRGSSSLPSTASKWCRRSARSSSRASRSSSSTRTSTRRK
jgi:ribose transport system substrate-binding protein